MTADVVPIRPARTVEAYPDRIRPEGVLTFEECMMIIALHPGRPWAVDQQDRGESAADIEQDIREYLRSRL